MSSSELAEDLKKRGNEAFAAKHYEDAIVLYDRAIEADPTNYVYYNNRAAANHELKHFDKAIEDARKGLAIQENAKSHQRIAAALWAQNKYVDARAEFEKALGLEPNNASAKQSINMLDKTMGDFVRSATASRRSGASSGPTMTMDGVALPPPQGGEFTTVPSGFLGMFLDLLVLACSVSCVICTFVVPSMGATMWRVLMLATIAQQFVVMKHQDLLKVNMEVFSTWFKHFSSLLAILCLMALVTGIGSQLLVAGFIGLYTVLSLAAHRAELNRWYGPLAALMRPSLDKLSANSEQYSMMAASLEATLTFAVPLSGGTWFTLVYTQYAINRYKSDRYVQAAFSSMRRTVLSATQRFLPAFVSRGFEKFCDVLYATSQQHL